METTKFKVILFYKYTHIKDPDKEVKAQRDVCKKLNIKGRMIIASEGINATLEGEEKSLKKYTDFLKEDRRFSDIHIKLSDGKGDAFTKLSIKHRREIVAMDLKDDIDPTKLTGKYLMVEELHHWFEEGKEFYIVDMRNDFEQLSGYFENSILPGMTQFRDLPKVIGKLKHLKGKTVLTVCTGGVRCEKASGFLIKNGFKDVYQLYGGIVTYMEKYPNENFLGSLYVFDGRLVIGFNRSDPKKVVVGECASCGDPSEDYVNCKDDYCHRHFIACEKCLDNEGKILCPMGCREYKKKKLYENKTQNA
jgi:UPF0176 protein